MNSLILYTVTTLEVLLLQVGFESVTLWSFQGEYNDKRIIAIAAKKNIAGSMMQLSSTISAAIRRD
jgi:hypothetical protein